MSEEIYKKRIQLAEDAIAHLEPERIPIWFNYGSTPHILDEDEDTTFKNTFYNHEKAAKSIIKFHQEFQPDVQLVNMFSGEAEEIAGTKYIDWPGRPGTKVPDTSVYQVHEYEFMDCEEYPKMIGNFSGFLIHKMLPRMFPGIEGIRNFMNPAPPSYMYLGQLRCLFRPDTLDALEKLVKIGRCQQQTAADIAAAQKTLTEMGFPPMFTGVGSVPYDTLANYYRGTLGMLEDVMDCPEQVKEAVDILTEEQIKSFQYFKFAKMPVKRVMFWMHQGVDGFLNPKLYEELYWRPFVKIINALVDMGVTPIVYTEGNYKTRLTQMTGLPKNKCVIHFENVDLQEAKNTLGKDNCITGNFPIYLLEYGTVEQVVDEAKRQIDIGAPGGGFIFETNASIENVKRENLAALYDTVREYGRK